MLCPYEVRPTGYVHSTCGISAGKKGAPLILPKPIQSSPIGMGQELIEQPRLLPLLSQNNNLPDVSFCKNPPIILTSFTKESKKKKFPCLAHSFFE